MSRGACNFTQKVRWAQALGAAAAIIHDDKSRGDFWGVIMSGDDEDRDDDPTETETTTNGCCTGMDTR